MISLFEAEAFKHFADEARLAVALKNIHEVSREKFINACYINEIVYPAFLLAKILGIPFDELNRDFKSYIKETSGSLDVNELIDVDAMSKLLALLFWKSFSFLQNQKTVLRSEMCKKYKRLSALFSSPSRVFKSFEMNFEQMIDSEESLGFFYGSIALQLVSGLANTDFRNIPIEQKKFCGILYDFICKCYFHSWQQGLNMGSSRILALGSENGIWFETKLKSPLIDCADLVEAETIHFLSFGCFNLEKQLCPVALISTKLSPDFFTKANQYQSFLYYARSPSIKHNNLTLFIDPKPGTCFAFDTNSSLVVSV